MGTIFEILKNKSKEEFVENFTKIFRNIKKSGFKEISENFVNCMKINWHYFSK